MSNMRLIGVCVFAVSLQLTVFADVRVFDVAPEMLALVAVLAGYFGGPRRGPVAAFLAGLLWDVYLPTPLGVAALVFALVAYGIASIEASLFHDSRFQVAAVTAVATAMIVVSYAMLSEILGQRGYLDSDVLRIAVISGVFNAILAVPAAPVVRWALAAGPRSNDHG